MGKEAESACLACGAGHTYDSFIDDGDFTALANDVYNEFVKRSVSAEDFSDDNIGLLNDIASDMVMDFIEEKTIGNIGYKYGSLTCVGLANVTEHLLTYLKKRFAQQTTKY